jgi:ornithine carbamoyltransferase
LNDLLRIGDLSAVELEGVLALALELRADPLSHKHAFDGRSLACFLDDPATRQHLAVAAAAQRLGLLPVMLTPREVEGLRADSTGDTPRVLADYVAGLVINALSDEEDPIQAVADLLTLQAHYDALAALTIAYIGAADVPVAHSLMQATARTGIHLRIACPPEHAPIGEILMATAALAPAHGGSVELVADPQDAVSGAQVVYTAASPEPLEEEFRVDTAMLRRAGPDAWLMHPLPAHRGQEVTVAALEGPHSLVLEQAANRLPAGQAALLELLR